MTPWGWFMSELVRFYSRDLGWIHVTSISNLILLGAVPSKAEGLIFPDSLLKLIFIPLAFFVLYLSLCYPSRSLVHCLFLIFSILNALSHLGLYWQRKHYASRASQILEITNNSLFEHTFHMQTNQSRAHSKLNYLLCLAVLLQGAVFFCPNYPGPDTSHLEIPCVPEPAGITQASQS